MPNEHSDMYEISVNQDKKWVPKTIETAAELLAAVDLNPNEVYLVQVQGHEQESFEGRPDARIRLHNGAKFVTGKSSGGTVS